MYCVSIKLKKHEWKFGRTRNAVGTRTFDCQKVIVFVPLCYTTGLKSSRQFFNQSEAKPKSVVTPSLFLRFASATCNASSSDWFTGLSVFFVIGYTDYFGFDFTTLNKNRTKTWF